MEQAKVGNMECTECKKDFELDDFQDFDIETGKGVCFGCGPRVEKPSQRHIDRIRSMGTPKQNADLDELLEIYNKQNPPKKIQYNTAVAPQVDELTKSMQYLDKRQQARDYKPEGITFDNVKHIFWQYFKQIVKRETGKEIQYSDLDQYTIEVIKNYIHWLIGSKGGKLDPKKSIYLYGPLGVGKSTIAETGYLVLMYLKYRTDWGNRCYKFISMDELFLETYTEQSLDKIGKVAKGSWCLDELREKHLTYKHYGNEFYILSDILTARHNLWKRNGTNTIITSNIPPGRLNTVLDDERLMDRIKQQYEIVELLGKNKRHLK